FWVALLPHQWCARSLEVQQEKNAAYIAAANPDAVLALIGRVRELEGLLRLLNTAPVVSFDNVFAALGFPADEAVELRADELATVLDVAEVERERDEAVSRSERVSSFAATLIGNACERHSAEIAVMG